MILTSNKIHLTTGSKLTFDHCSVNLSSSQNLYLISDTEINDLICQIDDKSPFSLFTISGNEITIEDIIDNSNVELISSAGKFVYKINLMFLSEEAKTYLSNLTISYDSSDIVIELYGTSEDIDQNLLVLLQNFKQYISEDYVSAFRESSINAKDIDNELYNRKMREMLHKIFDLTAMHSSYKNLLSSLSFFGYGDLLTIKEYWSSNDSYKSTDIANSVITSIDKHLIGYSKSNQMSLVYQINEKSGIDEDGLPIYSNVFANTDDILTKLYALERLLSKDYLYINTHIVDIVGEFNTIVSIEMNAILNSVKIENINLTDNIVSKVDYHFTNTKTFIERHNVIVEPFVLEENNDVLSMIPGLQPAIRISDVFHVINIADEFEDYDLLTKFYSGDFGLFELNIDFQFDRYQIFRYFIQDANTLETIFTSKSYNIETLLSNKLQFGIRNLGQYKIIIYLIDWYGSPTIVGLNDVIEVATHPIDIFIGKYDISGSINKDLDLYTTFKDTTDSTSNIVIDDTSSSININTWDQSQNVPVMNIARMYESDFDQYVTYTNLNQLNSIPLVQLDGLPLHTWGHFYGIGIFDILGDLSYAEKSIRLRNFSHLSFDEISKEYDGSIGDAEWLTSFVALINSYCLSNPDSTFNDFTWDLHWFSNNYLAHESETRPMLRAKSKLAGETMSNLDVELSTVHHLDFIESYLTNDLKIFSRVDANFQLTVVQPSISNLQLVIGDFFSYVNMTEINTTEELYIILDSLIPNELKSDVSITMSEERNSILIFSRWSVSITHGSINGTHLDIPRGLDSSKILKLSLGADVKRGEPFFAFIDIEKRIDLGDVVWTLKNALTNQIVSVQHAWSFRWIVSEVGSYSLTLNYTDKSGNVSSTKHGCIVVNDNQ